ncbi:MAG TPA: alpha/beta hydrolase [Streptosporangiaceae bacterium]|jgi:pimeloyl-ACP methyl ester carboxylesterase
MTATLAFERHGDGPPLILLHGVGHRRQAWYPVLDRLTPHRQVILVDLPGHGESPPLRTNGQPVVDAMLAEVLALLAELDLDRPHIAGNSLGGRIALEAGAAGKVATVTALSPAGFWRSDSEARYARTIFKVMQVTGKALLPIAPTVARSRAGRALTYSAIVSRPGQLSPEQAAGDMAAFVAAKDALNVVLAGLPNFTGRVPASLPVTIAWGTRDRLLPQRQVLVAKAWLPAARFVPLPGCGHVPMTDDPALVAQVLLRGSNDI